MNLALLVIDMQEKFERTSRDMNIVENVVSVVQACHRKNVPVFFTQHHDPEESGVLYSYNWLKLKNPIIKGSDRWRLISEIAAAVDEERDTVITEKTRYAHGPSIGQFAPFVMCPGLHLFLRVPAEI